MGPMWLGHEEREEISEVSARRRAMSPFLWTLVEVLGWALMHFVSKGALIGVATALSLLLMRGASPQSRYALLCVSLLLCLGVPELDVYRGIEATARASGGFRISDSHVMPTLNPRAPVAMEDILPWLVAAWIVGVAAMSCRLAAGLLWVRQIGYVFSDWLDTRWQDYVSVLAARCGMSRPRRAPGFVQRPI